jgi:RHS repeat-associated protein
MSGCTQGQTKYATLASPVTLSANTAYVLVSYEVGADKFHDYSGSILTTTAVATVLHGVYTTNGGQTWGAAGSTGNSYVPVDFQYTTGGTAEMSYLISDQLGTPRMVFDQSGDLTTTKRHDYAPFGEELFNGARTTAMGYAAGDLTRQKFTSKERDVETVLDYFGARYYSSSQGRFTGVDPIYVTLERLIDPQRINLYVYARNNPLVVVDPDGMDLLIDAKTEEDARRKFALLQKGLTLADRKHTSFFVGNGKNGYEKGKFYALVEKDHKEGHCWGQACYSAILAQTVSLRRD